MRTTAATAPSIIFLFFEKNASELCDASKVSATPCLFLFAIIFKRCYYSKKWGKITDFLAYSETYQLLFSFFIPKWRNFARELTVCFDL